VHKLAYLKKEKHTWGSRRICASSPIIVVDEVDVDHGVDVIIVEQSEHESTEMFPSHVAKKSHVASQPVG
jgi:hypothetical protein